MNSGKTVDIDRNRGTNCHNQWHRPAFSRLLSTPVMSTTVASYTGGGGAAWPWPPSLGACDKMSRMFRPFGLGLLIAGFAQAQIANLAIEHYALPNGMEVILHVDRK